MPANGHSLNETDAAAFTKHVFRIGTYAIHINTWYPVVALWAEKKNNMLSKLSVWSCNNVRIYLMYAFLEYELWILCFINKVRLFKYFRHKYNTIYDDSFISCQPIISSLFMYESCIHPVQETFHKSIIHLTFSSSAESFDLQSFVRFVSLPVYGKERCPAKAKWGASGSINASLEWARMRSVDLGLGESVPARRRPRRSVTDLYGTLAL